MKYIKQAIDIISNRDLTERDMYNILTEIVKSNPSVLVKAHRRLAIVTSSWKQEVIDMCRSGNKIAAIKRCREKTGLGLRDAKDTVERLVGI